MIENLRECTASQNGMNMKIKKTNSVGVKGVSIMENLMYKARIYIDGKRKSLGTFSSLEQAEAAIKIERNKHHGEFCNHG